MCGLPVIRVPQKVCCEETNSAYYSLSMVEHSREYMIYVLLGIAVYTFSILLFEEVAVPICLEWGNIAKAFAKLGADEADVS